jgi:hypothetical protein
MRSVKRDNIRRSLSNNNKEVIMTIDEAQVIFKSWQDYMESADKLSRLMLPVPESFLPYPADVLEEALNIISKCYFDSGNKRMSENIKKSMSYLLPFFMTKAETGARRTDEEAISELSHFSVRVMRPWIERR